MSPLLTKKAFWIAYMLLLICVVLVHISFLKQLQVGAIQAQVVSGIYGIALLLSAVLISNNLNYYRPQNFNYSYLLFWCLFFAAVVVWPLDMLVVKFVRFDSNYKSISSQITVIKFMFSFLILLCLALVSLLWYKHQDIGHEHQHRSAIQVISKEAELNKLRLQLQPHFLFNSLNSINALVAAKPNEARKMIQQLSDFLRFTVKQEHDQLIVLSDEITHVQLYLEIEKVRFGHRLSTIFDCQKESVTMKLPALLLQPIVENAIKFGLYGTTDDVTIKLTTKLIDNMLTIEVDNPFDKSTQMSSQGTGFGLKAIKKRLQLIYNRSDLLETSQTETLFITKIRIPQ